MAIHMYEMDGDGAQQEAIQTMPAQLQARDEVTRVKVKKHELLDGRGWAFDFKLEEQTIGT